MLEDVRAPRLPFVVLLQTRVGNKHLQTSQAPVTAGRVMWPDVLHVAVDAATSALGAVLHLNLIGVLRRPAGFERRRGLGLTE